MPWQVSISWIETDVSLKFLEIIKIFEAWGCLIYRSCEADWQNFHLFQYISRVDVFYVTYTAHTFSPLLMSILFREVKEISLKLALWRHLKYETIIVANLTVVVHSAEDCCASSMKLWVPKKRSTLSCLS